jgi:ATP-binding cassette subfamily C (CFTR/MRP) protein 4
VHSKKGAGENESPSLKFDDVSVIWSPREFMETETPVLRHISFDFKNFEKVAIIGRVGCGKSTLLQAVLKEAFIQSGSVSIQGTELRAAYAEQNPLIITGTVRSNILYGSPYDQEYYEKVVQACQLGADFDQFPKRDLTETGEMGVALSGGQKSRISLARAVYKKHAKIVLIDGTLSSLDARVSAKILEEIKNGELFQDKIVLMVTYDLDQAQQLDWVIHLSDDGAIQDSMSTADFFAASNQSLLTVLKTAIQT